MRDSRVRIWKQREWLLVSEAAAYVSAESAASVSDAEILRLGLDGRFAISVHFPAAVDVTAEAAEKTERGKIEGLCELVLAGPGRAEVERHYHSLAGLPYVQADGRLGAEIIHDGRRWRVAPYRGNDSNQPSAVPRECVLAIRRVALDELVKALTPIAEAVEPTRGARPLDSRERTTLLVLIGTLADQCGIDISQPSKAAGMLEGMTVERGHQIAARTIETHLRRVADAMERKKR